MALRGTSLISAGLALVLAFAAEAASAQTIRMWTFLNPAGKTGREVVLKKLIDGFEAANPGVKIQVEPQVFQQMSDKFFAAHQTGTAPDVIWLHSTRVIDGIKMGALANLDELFLSKWSKEDIDDVDDTFFRHGALANAHYQITHSRSSSGQFYRIDLFKEAGIDPKSLTTWDKFIAAAQKLTIRDASGNVSRYGFGQAFSIDAAITPMVFAVILDRQKRLFDDQGRAMWSTPAGIEGLTMQIDMVREYKVTPESAVTAKSDDLYDAFNAGHLAILRGPSARITSVMAAIGADKVGYLSTPSFTEGKNSPTEVLGWSAAVWSGSPNKVLAGKWVEYMSTKAADKLWALEAGAVPIRKSTVRDNPAFFAEPKNAYLSQVATEISTLGWFPPAAGITGWDEALNRAAQDVLTNNTDPKAALQKAETAFNRANRR